MFTKFKANREMTFEELQEIMVLMEEQETTDKLTSTTISINGNYSNIEVEIDEEGNVTLI